MFLPMDVRTIKVAGRRRNSFILCSLLSGAFFSAFASTASTTTLAVTSGGSPATTVGPAERGYPDCSAER